MAPTSGARTTGCIVGGGDTRVLAASVTDGVLLIHRGGNAPREVEVLDPVNGQRSVVCTLAGAPALDRAARPTAELTATDVERATAGA